MTVSPTTLLFLTLCCLMGSCTSYEPRSLAPAISLSPEQVDLQAEETGLRWDLGLEVSANESDSLFNLEVLPGLRVRAVTPNGPADLAGINSGDVILDIDGVVTNDPGAFAALRQQSRDGNFALRVQRGTVVFASQLQARELAAASTAAELFRIDPLATRAGYRNELLNLANQRRTAVRVVELFPNSPLPEAGIGVGDLIIDIDGEAISSAQNLVTRLNQDFDLGSRVSLGLWQEGQRREVTLRLWDPGRRLSRVHLGPLFNYESSLNPPSTSISLLDLWLFSLYRYQRLDDERSHSILGLISVESGFGELVEESQ